MEDITNPPAEAQPTGDQPSAADSPTAAYVTADMLQEFRRGLMDDIRRTTAGMLKTQPAIPQAPSAPAETKSKEPTTSAGEAGSDLLQTLMQKIDGLASDQASRDMEKQFSEQVSGLQLDSDDRASLRLSFTSDPDLFARQLAKQKAKHEPPPAKGPGFNGIGAPNPIAAQDRETDPMNWDADTVARYRADGTFLKRIADHKATLPGGNGGLFKPKNRKG